MDHLGRIPEPSSINSDAHLAIYRLLDAARCWVKLSAPYHNSHDPTGGYKNIAPLARYLIANYPDRLLWGSNWPHPNAIANPPDDKRLLKLICDSCVSDKTIRQILIKNPATLYGFTEVSE